MTDKNTPKITQIVAGKGIAPATTLPFTITPPAIGHSATPEEQIEALEKFHHALATIADTVRVDIKKIRRGLDSDAFLAYAAYRGEVTMSSAMSSTTMETPQERLENGWDRLHESDKQVWRDVARAVRQEHPSADR